MRAADPLDPHALTIATARGRRLCKTRHADGRVIGYDAARTLDLTTTSAPDLGTLAALLGELATRRNACILRGAIFDACRTRGVRRLLHTDVETGDTPTLRETPRAWLALDLDSLPLPDHADPRDLAACSAIARASLPGAFHEAACIVAATASHTLKPGARLRLWFMLSRAVGGAECKRWLATAPVDRSVFGAAQPIYTAAPVFIGMADPLPRRLVVLLGAERVTAPSVAALAPPPRPRPPSTPRTPSRPGDAPTARLTALLYAVRCAGEGERHPKLFWAACRAGEMVRAGEVSAGPVIDALTRAAMDAGGQDEASARRTAEHGVSMGGAA